MSIGWTPLAETDKAPFADLAAGQGDSAADKTDPNQIVYLAFTSGTTGKPKGVMHSDNTLLANARQLAKDWSIGNTSVVYTLSPLSHNLGFGAQVMALAMGAELVIHDLPRGASLADRILETDTSFLVGVPPNAIDLLAEMQKRGLKGLGRLTGFRISGSAVPSEVVAGLIAQGIKPQSGYGMTENCGHQYTMPDDDARLIIETSGKMLRGLRASRLQGRRSRHRGRARRGRPARRARRRLMLGYFDDQAATEDAFNKSGWFMTGDLGTIDAQGYLRIAGRSKDIIIRGGHNIHPARIEELATRHPAVQRAAAVPVKDARLGEKVCLAVVIRAGQGRRAGRTARRISTAAGLSKYDMPEYFLRLDEIPLTPNGKMLKRAIVDWIADGKRHARNRSVSRRRGPAQLTPIGPSPYERTRFGRQRTAAENQAKCHAPCHLNLPTSTRIPRSGSATRTPIRRGWWASSSARSCPTNGSTRNTST